MHYGLLLLSMCIACVYSSPLLRDEQQENLLSKYIYEVEDNVDKLNQKLVHFPEEKDENSSESNSDPIVKVLSVESEDLSSQQVDNENPFQDDTEELKVHLIK